MAAYEAAFADLIARLPPKGRLVCAEGFEPLARLTAGRPVIWYGRGPGADYRVEAIEPGEITRFHLATPDARRIPLQTELLGAHNLDNIAGAAALLLERGEVDEDQLAAGVRAFRGVARRLDKKTRRSRVPVYEGFGSSYDKARSAITAVAGHFPDRPLWVIFEPHTFSWRNAAALAWYDTVFEGAARVLLLPPPAHGATSHDQLDAAAILKRVREAGVAADLCETAKEVLAIAEDQITGEEVILLLSSGPLAGLADSLPALMDDKWQ